ncbi:MAG TPA: metallophosphoesterase, partial [Nitrososphaeraceae archaeon]|nr:metallophosphoesterase [Nitrososphaeraceae archaeon]
NDSYSVESQNATDNVFNIIAISDVGCSMSAQENIKNIEKLQPELFLIAGDLSYAKTPNCWFDMTKSLDSKTKIAIGNHDDYEEEGQKGENLKKSYMDHYGLNNSYYSFDYKNVHVLVLDTQLELYVDTLASTAIVNEPSSNKQENKNGNKDNKDKNDSYNKKEEPLLERFPMVNLDDLLKRKSIDIDIPQLDKLVESNAKVPSLDIDKEQYKFVLDDLNKTKQNKDIDWIFVMFHKPMYSPLSKQFEEYIIRNKYQPIFDKYGVDLVIQGHNHIYSRTLPLSFNKLNISQPIIDQNNSTSNNSNIFTNPNGTIFLVVGAGGAEPYRIVEEPYYIANQYNEGFGFVDLKINDKRLDGVFYDINLNCKMEITEKKGKEKINLESCIPATTNNNNLKVIDQFAIEKISNNNGNK